MLLVSCSHLVRMLVNHSTNNHFLANKLPRPQYFMEDQIGHPGLFLQRPDNDRHLKAWLSCYSTSKPELVNLCQPFKFKFCMCFKKFLPLNKFNVSSLALREFAIKERSTEYQRDASDATACHFRHTRETLEKIHRNRQNYCIWLFVSVYSL